MITRIGRVAAIGEDDSVLKCCFSAETAKLIASLEIT